MTKKQLREHKQGNQERKKLILVDIDARGRRSSAWFLGGVIQDGNNKAIQIPITKTKHKDL